ncbi:MAG TPA: ABC transporter substrate-binding protein [Candidatus Binatia bacterium]|jgi:NitT/TauT family transport system substrate-binding protein
MKRLSLLLGAVALFLVASPLEAEHKTLNIAQGYVAADILPLWIANERKLFEKHGLETTVTYVRGGKNIVAALLSGQSDLAVILPSSFLLANLQGADFVFVGNSHSVLKYVLMAHPSIKAPAQLKGKRLAISSVGDLSHAMTLLALQRLGIDRKALEIIQVGQQPDRILALRNGSVQATTVSTPFDFLLKKEGFVSLFDTSNEVRTLATAYTVRQKFLQSAPHRLMTERFLSAMTEAVKIIKTERDYSLRVLDKNLRNTDAEILNYSYDFLAPAYHDTPRMKGEEVQTLIDLIVAPDKRKELSAEKLMDNSLVAKIEKGGS